MVIYEQCIRVDRSGCNHSNTTSTAFHLQPAPCGRKIKLTPQLAVSHGDAHSANANSSSHALKSVFEDEEDEVEQDVQTPTPLQSVQHRSRVTSASPLTPTPNAVRHTFAQRLMSQPSPSALLSQRRTLMRSLSSSCLLTSSTSPKRSEPLLRKRLGWQQLGEQKVQQQQDIVIPFSPQSPLSPNRARQLHTPTTPNSLHAITFTMVTNRGEMGSAADTKEPLSATLKALGAKRHSDILPVTTSTHDDDHDDFQVLTATPKMFFLPTWAHLRKDNAKRTVVLEDNRRAAQGFQTLLLPRHFKEDNVAEGKNTVGSRATALLGDDAVLPRVVQATNPPVIPSNSQRLSSIGQARSPVCSANVSRPAIATLRANRNRDSISSRVSGMVAALCGTAQANPALPAPHCNNDRRDGWGGILTRLSWFQSHTRGPLISPRKAVRFAESFGSHSGPKPLASSGLKSLYLVASATPNDAKAVTQEWEDVNEPTDKPEICQRPPQRSVQPSALQTKPRAPAVQDPFADDEKSNNSVVSHLIAGAQSVEERPSTMQRVSRTYALVVVLILSLLASVIANIVLATTRTKSR